ncbi:MAG: hypothetical protein J6S98_02600 [Lentisphaeria bacterium]|jgi:type IV secretory pathway VirB4 component|nr:hypothetical protein [Lentisphaerota bacterium]MBO5694273.1 hypothetical protein [Lentisphaeria bacterium]MBR4884254.1 hypothetical protein [Lentisphaeria bacterium]
MSHPEEQSAVQKLKSAGRDLMPIIAVCVSAIVLTLVAVTVYKLMIIQTKEPVNLQPTLLEKRYLDLLARAERHLQENNLETATKEYLAARNMAEQENGSTILLAELELRLARIMLLQHRPERAEKHIRRAVVFLQKTQSSVDEQLRDLQKIIAEQKAAGQQKERMP